MKIKNIFNGMGFSGQLGKLGTVIAGLLEDVENLSEDVENLLKDVQDLKLANESLTGRMDTITPLINVTVTFDTDGGSEVQSQSISFGTAATEPDTPTKEGYEFIGWFIADDEFNFESEISGNITLIAHWTEVIEG